MDQMKDMTEPELKQLFNSICRSLKSQLPKDVVGFVLVAFGDDGVAQYGSSIDRESAIPALREFADRLERHDAVER